MAASIDVACDHCGARHKMNLNLAGRRVRCPDCDTLVQVPYAAPLDGDPAEVDSPTDVVDAIDPADDSIVGTDGELMDRDDVSDTSLTQVEPLIEVVPVLQPPPVEHTHHGAVDPTHVLVLDEEEDDDEVLVRSKRPDEEIDMTPMVDVTFLLLIFFMVTAAFSLQKSIQMPRQQTDAPSANVDQEIEDLDVVEIQVDEYGSFLVMAPAFERETPGKQNLITALREAIAANPDGMKLDIKVHEFAKLHALVDAMDAGTIAGFSELKVKQVDDFD